MITILNRNGVNKNTIDIDDDFQVTISKSDIVNAPKSLKGWLSRTWVMTFQEKILKVFIFYVLSLDLTFSASAFAFWFYFRAEVLALTLTERY